MEGPGLDVAGTGRARRSLGEGGNEVPTAPGRRNGVSAGLNGERFSGYTKPSLACRGSM
jgi:hypothetical protein